MRTQKLKVEVEVWGIEVEETQSYQNGNGSGWWEFQYRYRLNGGKWKEGVKDGSWSSQTRNHFRRILGHGYASKEVLRAVF